MRFSCKYDSLLAYLTEISNVVEDSLANEDDKNAIFQFTKGDDVNSVRLIGISPSITFRHELLPSEYQLTLEDSDVDVNGVMYVQLKSKELLSFLNSYKSVRKTSIDEVIFEPERGNIKCTVIELPKFTDEEMEALVEELAYNPSMHDPREDRFVSHWMFKNIPIKPNKLPSINLEAPTSEYIEVPSATMLTYTSSLLPIMENTTSLFSFMQFSDGRVVAQSKAFITFMANFIDAEFFNGFRLSYRILTFIEKFAGTTEVLSVAKTDKHLYFKTDSSEVFVLYDTKIVSFQTQSDMVSKDSFIKVDRIYLKDVLKRLSLVNDSVEVFVKTDEGIITVSNSKFSQDIRITGTQNMEGVPRFKFKIMPDVLNKAIIGNDDFYVERSNPESADTIIYCCRKETSVEAIVFADYTNAWLSLVRVKVY